MIKAFISSEISYINLEQYSFDNENLNKLYQFLVVSNETLK